MCGLDPVSGKRLESLSITWIKRINCQKFSLLLKEKPQVRMKSSPLTLSKSPDMDFIQLINKVLSLEARASTQSDQLISGIFQLSSLSSIGLS